MGGCISSPGHNAIQQMKHQEEHNPGTRHTQLQRLNNIKINQEKKRRMNKSKVPLDISIALVLPLPDLLILRIWKTKNSRISINKEKKKVRIQVIKKKKKSKERKKDERRIGHTEIPWRDLARTVEDNSRIQSRSTIKQEEEAFRRRGFLLAILTTKNRPRFATDIFLPAFGALGLSGKKGGPQRVAPKQIGPDSTQLFFFFVFWKFWYLFTRN